MTGFNPVDWVDHHARVRPESIALQGLDNGETRNWSALEERVARLAGGLLAEFRLQPGDRVATLTDGNIRFLELQFACLRAGLTLVPLNFRLTGAELVEMCLRMRPKLMITDGAWATLAREVAAQSGIATTIDWDGSVSGFETIAINGRAMKPRTDMAVDEIALILFTSGSTGSPKATISTLGALIWQSLNQAQASRVADADSHVFTPLPLFHAGGLNSVTNPILFFGGKATISARFDPAQAARFLGDAEAGVTHVALVPLMYELIAAQPEFEAGDFSALRTAIVAGGRLPSALQERWLAKGVHFRPNTAVQRPAHPLPH